jgi:hypothetical protein
MKSLDTSFKHLRNYFKSVQEEHKKLKGFVTGTSSKVRQHVADSAMTPVLWLEVPFIDIRDSGSSFSAGKSSAFVVMAPLNERDKTEAEQEDLYDELEEIALDVLSRLAKDAKANLHKITIDGTLEPIDPLLIDGFVGWRFEFEMKNWVEVNYKTENWN